MEDWEVLNLLEKRILENQRKIEPYLVIEMGRLIEETRKIDHASFSFRHYIYHNIGIVLGICFALELINGIEYKKLRRG